MAGIEAPGKFRAIGNHLPNAHRFEAQFLVELVFKRHQFALVRLAARLGGQRIGIGDIFGNDPEAGALGAHASGRYAERAYEFICHELFLS